ncbi:hypothetical protein KIN20_029925 [Parelaphostrongylus tenuis]|uniref:Uncharacterized protein n=1 Tax=Parelaphostrongylus tenuis TaxID=148309 RepID=A0AAD5WFY1_PARTN|nr:hypothetical protein KIN20_029925 [Parelaphostrongylus tenuis]
MANKSPKIAPFRSQNYGNRSSYAGKNHASNNLLNDNVDATDEYVGVTTQLGAITELSRSYTTHPPTTYQRKGDTEQRIEYNIDSNRKTLLMVHRLIVSERYFWVLDCEVQQAVPLTTTTTQAEKESDVSTWNAQLRENCQE